MSLYSQARACGVNPDADADPEDYDRYAHHYVCAATEDFAQYRANYVCPWCGEGVMELDTL